MAVDRAARLEALVASVRPDWIGRQFKPGYDWQDFARHAADGLLLATAPTARKYAASHVRVAIETAIEALDRLEAEDATQ